jgi:hypothetical protein
VLKYDVKERFVEENEQPVVEKERKKEQNQRYPVPEVEIKRKGSE